jgi:hypothetical protein
LKIGVIALEFHNGALGTVNYTVNSYGKNMEGSLYYFWRKGTVKIWYLNELEYQNIEGFEFKDLRKYCQQLWSIPRLDV